jgi:hypothetical protein
MSVYASICMYFYQKYMHIHQAVYERISNSIFGSIFVCIFNSISCCIFCAHTYYHGAVTVASPRHSPAPARGLCPRTPAACLFHAVGGFGPGRAGRGGTSLSQFFVCRFRKCLFSRAESTIFKVKNSFPGVL